jgi:hypothetical protein
MPQTMVSQSGMLSRSPGATSLPSSPMTVPPMRAQRMALSMGRSNRWTGQDTSIMTCRVLLCTHRDATATAPPQRGAIGAGVRQLRKPTWPATPPPIST